MSPEERRRLEEQQRIRDTVNRVINFQRERSITNPRPQQSFFNKVRDVFDANTPSDVYRRQQAGQAANYAQQQKDHGVVRIANNPWERTLNLGKSVGESFYAAPKRLGEMVEEKTAGQKTIDAQGSLANRQKDLLNKFESRATNPSLSLQERAVQRSLADKMRRQLGVTQEEQKSNLTIRKDKLDVKKNLAALADVGLTIASAGVAGVAGKTLGKNIVQVGTKQAFKTAAPAFFTNLGINTAQGVTSTVAGAPVGQNASWKDIAKGAGLGATVGTVADLGFAGIGAALGAKQYKSVLKNLAEETDFNTIRQTVGTINKNLPSETLDDIATQLVGAKKPTEVNDIMRAAAQKEQTLTTPLKKSKIKDDASFNQQYKARLDARPDNLRAIENSTTNMTDAERLRLAGGDVGQAGIGSEPGALAKAKAKMAQAIAEENAGQAGTQVAKQPTVSGDLVQGLANESDSTVVKQTIRQNLPDLPEDVADTLSKKIASTADETEIQKLLTQVVTDESNIATRGVKNAVTPPVTTTAPGVSGVISEDVVKAFTGTKTPQQVRDSISALFPELDETTKVRITQELAQSTDNKTTRQILEQAQAQRKALTEGVQNVTPQAEALPPTQEQQIAQAAQEQPQAQLTSNQAPDPNIEANQVIAQPNPAQAVPVVPGATNPNVVPDTEVLFGNAPQFTERGLSIPQKLSADRVIRENITNPLERAKNDLIFKAQTSSNPIARGLGRLTQGISREAGVSPELLAQKRLLRGGVETGKLVRESVSDLGNGLSKEAKTKVWSTLDPERASELGLKVAKTAELTPEETAYRTALIQIKDYTTQGNLERGLITPEQAADPNYLKRGYSIFEEGSDNSKVYSQTRDSLLKQFKGRKDVNEKLIEEAITDPGYLVAKKSAESHAAWAMVDYAKYLTDSGLVSDVEKAGYRQLPTSKLFGDASGKFVPVNIAEDFTGFQYNNGMMSAFNDLITAYDSLGIRKAKKELLTVFNPAVRGGNQASNRLIFSNMNGINPLQFNKAYIEVGKDIAEKSQIYREAVAQGLTGIDITQADFAARISDYVDDPNVAKKAVEWTKKSYSAADDKARVAAFKVWRERGYSANDAAALVQRGFQDYKSVGFFYDIAAKTPLIGNAFVRFAGDSIRIAKNAALDHPLRTAATVALWANMVNIMSKVSGETPEDKATREGRFGAPKLPGTDISLTVQTPWGEVNAARFLPFYQLNDVQSAVGRFLPVQGNPFTPQGWQDPLLGQFGQLATDTDFRGKSIADPKNTVDDQGNKRYVDELPQKERNLNRARFFGVQNLPLGREIDQIGSAIKNVPDQYGKIRSVPQAILRSGGVKVEQFGAQQAKDQRATNDYFKERDRINAEIKNLPRADQEAYKRLTGYYKLRKQTDNTFKPGTKRDLKAPVYEFSEDKWKDYTSHPGLYELQVKEKVNASKPKPDGSPGVPLQPEFNPLLSEGFRKQLINNKSLAPGENVEANARMYNDPEWDKYQQLKDQYKAEAAKYYPQSNGEFTDELVKHQQAPFPKKGAAKQAYDDAYKAYAEGRGAKPTFTDAVAADKEAYNDAQWRWTNNERKARGLPPISKKDWDNVTFGFQSDEERVYNELKYGKGYGNYGRNGYGRFGRSGGSSKKEKTPKTYIGTLLGDAPSVNSNEISIKTAPTRAKFKVKTPSGKGRNYKKIKLA